MAKFVLEVTEEVTYGNRTYESAAMFTSHKLIPGTYPMEHPKRNFGGPDTGSYETYVDNYLMASDYNGVTSNFFVPGERHSLRLDWYKFEVQDGKEVKLGMDKIGTFRQIED